MIQEVGYMAEKKSTIFNLLKPIEPPATVWDKIYDWLVKQARVIVMIAEVFIAVAFFAKVIVDTQAKDKQEDVDALIAEANLYTDENGVANARKFRYLQIQNRDRDYISLWNNSSNVSNVLSEIYSYVPNQSNDITITVSSGNVTISGQLELSTLEQIEDQIDGSDTFASSEITLIIEQSDAQAGVGTYILQATLAEDQLTRSDLVEQQTVTQDGTF